MRQKFTICSTFHFIFVWWWKQRTFANKSDFARSSAPNAIVIVISNAVVELFMKTKIWHGVKRKLSLDYDSCCCWLLLIYILVDSTKWVAKHTQFVKIILRFICRPLSRLRPTLRAVLKENFLHVWTLSLCSARNIKFNKTNMEARIFYSST